MLFLFTLNAFLIRLTASWHSSYWQGGETDVVFSFWSETVPGVTMVWAS